MKWLYVTVGLLAMSACLIGWIYLRDRDTSSVLPSTFTERQSAQIAAITIFKELGGGGDCRSGCATVLRRTQPRQWLVRITVKWRPRCLRIDLDTFRVSQPAHLTGVQPIRCPHDPSAAAHAGAGP
jgi:hypothetical protein